MQFIKKANKKTAKWLFRTSLKEKAVDIKKYYHDLSLTKKIIFPLIPVLLAAGIWIFIDKIQKPKTTYETEAAVKGTLIVSTSGSGTITSGNYTNITTKVSGTVKTVYVTNGDTVTKGQKLAEVTLDEYAVKRQADAWASYLDAVEAVNTAKIAQINSDKDMWTSRQTWLDTEEEYNNMIAGAWNPDTNAEYTYNEKAILTKEYEAAKLTFEANQTKYTNSTADIAKAQAGITSALRDYQENSATIYAPASGTVSDLALFEGLSVSANSSTSSTTGSTIISSQTVGKINDPDGQLIATVSMSETDVLNIKANQKVVITIDAYSDMTFTGKVLAVNTSGSVTSSVTSYPVTILLDSSSVDIYPNMAINVEIITNSVADAVMVPSNAINTAGGVSTVQIMKDGKPVTTTVEVGTSNDFYTVITSGINEGEIVVTSIIVVDNSTEDDDSSLFTGNTTTSGTKSSSSGSSNMGGGMPGGGMPGGF